MTGKSVIPFWLRPWPLWTIFGLVHGTTALVILLLGPDLLDWTLFSLTIPFLVWLSVRDWRTFSIPDLATAMIACLAVVRLYFIFPDLAVVHFVVAVTSLAAFWAFGEYLFRKRGQEALGLGDTKLIAAMGLFLGPQGLAILIFVASAGGIVFALSKTSGVREIPFGPFLAYGFVLAYALTVWMGELPWRGL